MQEERLRQRRRLGCPGAELPYTHPVACSTERGFSHREQWCSPCLPPALCSPGHWSTEVRNRKGQHIVPVMSNSISSKHHGHLTSPLLFHWTLYPVSPGFYKSGMWFCYKQMCQSALYLGKYMDSFQYWGRLTTKHVVSGLLEAVNKRKEGEEDKKSWTACCY